MTLKNLPDLHLPDQTLPEGGEFDSRPEPLQTWIAALPLASVDETSRLVFKALTTLNRTPLPTLQRHQALELLGEPVRYVTDALKRHYVKSHLPLPAKPRSIALQVRDLEAEMAAGYKIVVTELAARVRARQETEILAAAVYRAMFYLGRVLVTSYQLYTPAPARVWQELHSLYRYAEGQQLHRNAIASTGKPVTTSATTMDLYQQILLLALAEPYCLTQEEMDTLSLRLSQGWAAQCTLHLEIQEHSLRLHLEDDMPPRLAVGGEAPSACRCLVTSQLLGTLQNELAHLLQSGTQPLAGAARRLMPPTLASHLIRRLLRTWGGASRRVYSRAPQTGAVQVTFGLSATHHIISRPTGKRTQPVTRALPLDPPRGPAPRDVWDQVYPRPRAAEDGTAPVTTHDSVVRAPVPSPRYSSYACQLINEGPGGACVRWANGETPLARVGEIISLYHQQDTPGTTPRGVGVIRWIKQTRTQALEVGIQLLGPQAQPVTTRPEDSEDLTSDSLRGLLLPELKAAGAPPTLITPNFLYRPGDVVNVADDGGEWRMQLNRVFDSTAAYTRFGFSELVPGEQPEPPSADQNIESAWSSA